MTWLTPGTIATPDIIGMTSDGSSSTHKQPSEHNRLDHSTIVETKLNSVWKPSQTM